jgi:nitroreductase
MDNPVLKAIADRRSIRSYNDVKVSREQIDILLKAAQEAPSARNTQPWHFSVVQDEAILKDIYEEAKKNMKEEMSDIFHGARTAIFLSCDPVSRWARLDCGICVQTIALAAHSIGLGSVILGRPEAAFTSNRGAELNTLLNFPEGHAFAVAIAVGVPAGTKEAHPIEPGRITFVE